MSEAATAADFPGVPAATAAELARQHNEMSGFRPGAALAPNPNAPSVVARSLPASPMHALALADRAAELRKNDPALSDATAKELARQEAAYRSGSGIDKSVMIAEWAAGQTGEEFERSIDEANAKPAKAPHEFAINLGAYANDQTAQELDRALRGAMFSAGLSVEAGNAIAAGVDRTAAELNAVTPEAADAWAASQERALRELWGSNYEAKLATVRGFLRDAGSRSRELRSLLESYPQLFSSWQTVMQLSDTAESQRRILSRGRR